MVLNYYIIHYRLLPHNTLFTTLLPHILKSVQAVVLLNNLLTASAVKHAETTQFRLELLNSVAILLISQEATVRQVVKNVWNADVSNN